MAIAKISSYTMPTAECFPKNRTDWQLDPARAVLLIHDMQDYFLKFYDVESACIKTLINNLQRVRTWAHQQNIPVVYTAQPHEQSAEDRALLNAMWGPGLTAARSEQQKIIDPLSPSEHDIVLSKWRYSAFKRSDLLQRMQAWKRDQLIIGGVYAHIGCMITAVDAFMHDIQPFLLGDAVADFSEQQHQFALNYVSSCCGQVIATDALVQPASTRITRQWLEQKIQHLIEEQDIDPDENLIVYGLDSLGIMRLASELKAQGIEVSYEELGRSPSLANWWSLVEARQC